MVSLIKSIRTNSGVEELITENYLGYQNYNDDIQLEEGLVFFKNSKRLTKLAFKMDKKSNKAKNPVYREELQKLSTKMKEAAKDFEVLENKYKAARGSDKKKVKEEFAGLKKNYSDLVSMVNKETVRKAILSVGLGALTAFSIFNLYGFIVSAGGLSPAVATATAEASKLLSGARNVVTQRLEKAFQFIKQNPNVAPEVEFSSSQLSMLDAGADRAIGSVATREASRQAFAAARSGAESSLDAGAMGATVGSVAARRAAVNAIRRTRSSMVEMKEYEEGVSLFEGYIVDKNSKKGFVKNLFEEIYKNTSFENTEEWFIAYKAITSLDK